MLHFFQSNQHFLTNLWLHLYSYTKNELYNHFLTETIATSLKLISFGIKS